MVTSTILPAVRLHRAATVLPVGQKQPVTPGWPCYTEWQHQARTGERLGLQEGWAAFTPNTSGSTGVRCASLGAHSICSTPQNTPKAPRQLLRAVAFNKAEGSSLVSGRGKWTSKAGIHSTSWKHTLCPQQAQNTPP